MYNSRRLIYLQPQCSYIKSWYQIWKQDRCSTSPKKPSRAEPHTAGEVSCLRLAWNLTQFCKVPSEASAHARFINRLWSPPSSKYMSKKDGNCCGLLERSLMMSMVECPVLLKCPGFHWECESVLLLPVAFTWSGSVLHPKGSNTVLSPQCTRPVFSPGSPALTTHLVTNPHTDAVKLCCHRRDAVRRAPSFSKDSRSKVSTPAKKI
jgi:hypothetical protein